MAVKKTNGVHPPPLRIFVGTSAGGEDAEACAALEAGLRRRASIPVEVKWLALERNLQGPCGGWRTERWATPWTALRWAVPEICGFRGRAAYFDCPTLVLGDVAELAHAEVPRGAFVLARHAGRTLLTGCLLFDCAEARGHLDALAVMKANVGAHQEVGGLLVRRPRLVGPLPAGWGLDDLGFSLAPDSSAKSVSFAAPHTQPHGPRADARLAREDRPHWFTGTRLPHYSAKLRTLWEEEFVRAVQDGYGFERYVPSEPWGPYAIGGVGQVSAGRT